MGFFSRFFKIREQDPDSAETTWAMEDNGSELVLDPEYAATLMTELDLDAAIANHEVWRQQLEDLVHGRSGEVPQAEPICSADRCDLGRWLGGTGRLRLGHYPAFGMLVARHQYFHQQAAAVVDQMRAGDQPKVPVLAHFGERDHWTPLDSVQAFDRAQPGVEVQVYQADHGFNCDQRGSYDEAAALAARDRTLAFFDKHLG